MFSCLEFFCFVSDRNAGESKHNCCVSAFPCEAFAEDRLVQKIIRNYERTVPGRSCVIADHEVARSAMFL